MKSITYKKHSLRGRLMCAILGHKFKTIKYVTDHFKEFECRICHLQVTNDITNEKVSLTQEHRQINKTLIKLYRKKLPI